MITRSLLKRNAILPILLVGTGQCTSSAVGQLDEPFPQVFELSSLESSGGSIGFALHSIQQADRAGGSVSSAGDINGDGIDDLLIGASNASLGAGETYVIYGTAEGFGGSFELASLDGSNGFVILGPLPGDSSGTSVSSAGDVNGDGIDDIVIGASRADPGGNESAGITYVIYGRDASSSGGFPALFELSSLDGSNGFMIQGIDTEDFSGHSVSSAGDINGDSVNDILIGAHLAEPGGNDRAGETYVVFGRNTSVTGPFAAAFDFSSLDGSNGFVMHGISIESMSGYSVSCAGDVNDDGLDDIVIGARRANANGVYRPGQAYVVYGSASGFSGSMQLSTLDGTNGFAINGINQTDNCGVSVSSAGDVNGDGVSDILIGADEAYPGERVVAGESYVVFGRSEAVSGGFGPSFDLSSLDGTNGFVLKGVDPGDQSGNSVSSAGDVNGDGVDDILIGASRAAPNGVLGAGETYVVFGKRVDTDGKFAAAIELSSLNGENGFVLNGINTNDRSGFSVTSAGDLNNDGVDDLAIGARDATRFGKMPTTGEVYVIYGRRLAANPCTLADVNDDGVVTPADFSAWVAAFNTMMPGCDQNGDSLCTPADFSAWVANYNSNCED